MHFIINDKTFTARLLRLIAIHLHSRIVQLFSFSTTFNVYLSCNFPSLPTDTTYCELSGFVHLISYDRGHGNYMGSHQVAIRDNCNEYFLTHAPRAKRIRCGQLLLPKAFCFNVCPLHVLVGRESLVPLCLKGMWKRMMHPV